MNLVSEWIHPGIMVDIPAIDEQHQDLLQKLNAVVLAMQQQKSANEVTPMIAYLENHLIAHFQAEELLMRRWQYSKFKEHQAEHSSLLNQCRQVILSFHESPEDSAWLCTFKTLLQTWFKRHIAEEDMAMSRYLKPRMNLTAN